jgi:hypothetical protein
MTANVANLRYDSLQASVNKRFGAGLTFQAAYTLGRTWVQNENAGLYSYNWKNYTGYVSGTDRRQILAINYTYDVPKFAQRSGWNNVFSRALLNDWQWAHLMTFFSGQRYSPGFSIQQANTTSGISLNQVFLGTPDLGPRLTVQGDPNSLTKDLAHQFDPSKLGISAIFPGADGTGERNFLDGRGSFTNDISLTKAFRIRERAGFELRANFYNAFNQVRRLGINTSVQYKAKGRTFADGFTVYNTPEANAQRLAATGVTNSQQLYNIYRTGVGQVNLTGVEPMRIIEIGLKLRF